MAVKPGWSLLPMALAGAFSLLGGVTAYYFSLRVSSSSRRTYLDSYTFTPWELEVPYEKVEFRSSDGLRLVGWWLPRPETNAVIVCSHGHNGRKDELLGIGSYCWRAGYNVLLFDYRGRGESDAWPKTLVSREVDDLLAALQYVRQRMPDAAIGVIGYSMGAAVGILATARDQSVRALVADSSFTTGDDVVADAVEKVLRVPLRPLVHLADTIVAWRHGYRFSQARPIDVIGQIAPRPVFLIHGVDDSLVPVCHVRQLYAAAREPRLVWEIPGAEHCGGYFVDRVGYCRRVVEFFDQYLRSVEA
ncbi:MAG: alpha/beta hydrolase [Chloroflexus sp.]|uniref:alpha/beta hydrolase n=1 Tax=Chloroflexus sp. TaxID=1904827 RepID=UPI00404A5991